MVGNIISPDQFGNSGGGGGFDPDSIFDPTTHVATEADFITLLENGIYDSKYIGYKVQLSSSSGYYNNGLWVIADVNHDSANTGQTNCYDLISENCFGEMAYGVDSNWRDSMIRSFLNGNSYLNKFSSEFKAHILNLKYKSNGSWYNDDKIIIPSEYEVGLNSQGLNEGMMYPIFTEGDSSKRQKYIEGSQNFGNWWTRTRSDSEYVILVGMWGYSTISESYNYYYIAPLMRVQ